jgi:hypothetical protein
MGWPAIPVETEKERPSLENCRYRVGHLHLDFKVASVAREAEAEGVTELGTPVAWAAMPAGTAAAVAVREAAEEMAERRGAVVARASRSPSWIRTSSSLNVS